MMLQKKSSDKYKRNPLDFFVIAVPLSAIIYFVIYAIIGNGRFTDIFFLRGGDFFMDFFNSVRDASQGSAVYTERGVIYPPMANLIFLIFSRFTPAEYNSTAFPERHTWTSYFAPHALVMLCVTVCAVILFFLVYSSIKNSSRLRRFAFAFFAFFSVPVLFMLERGNILIVCLIALMIYAITYNSPSKLYREIGLICLAFAFSLKLYPAVFGWFLIADKRKKEALRCVAYGVAMLIIPSFFFGGPVCLYQMALNIFGFSAGSESLLSTILSYISMPALAAKIFTVLVYAWVAACAICFALSPFVSPQKPWRTWIVGLAALMCIPSLTSLYNWAFFLIPLVMLCNKQEHSTRDWLYTIMLTLPFIFIPKRIMLHVSLGMAFVYVVCAALSIFAVVDTASDVYKYVKIKKSEN